MTDDPVALIVLLFLILMCLIEFGCAGAPGMVRCPDGTAAFWPDLATDRAIEPDYCR